TCRPDQACHMPSSKSCRFTALSMAVAVTITSVAVTASAGEAGRAPSRSAARSAYRRMGFARLPWMSESLKPSFAGAAISACDDIDVLPTPHDFQVFLLQLAIGNAFTCLEIIFVAMPWADEVNFVVGKSLPHPAAIGTNNVFNLVHDDALAGRSALVDA